MVQQDQPPLPSSMRQAFPFLLLFSVSHLKLRSVHHPLGWMEEEGLLCVAKEIAPADIYWLVSHDRVQVEVQSAACIREHQNLVVLSPSRPCR